MMKEILRLIHDKGVVNTPEIAETIGVSQSMVQQAIAVLQSKGYLETVKSRHDSNASCASCAGCHSQCISNPQTNTLTFL